MRKYLVLAIAASSMLFGCSDPTSADIASSSAGAWSIREQVPGNYFGMTLVANGTELSGTGSFVGEAGPGGNSTVDGGVTNGIIHLDFKLYRELPGGVDTVTSHFTGQLFLRQLVGTLWVGTQSPDNPPGQTVFVRSN
ncbi:MAG: hypothetical protein ABI446_00270 [Gemmatimonadaceae bacterium]